MRPLLPVLLLLAACESEPERQLSGSPSDNTLSPGEPEPWVPPTDTATGTLEEEWADQATQECGAMASDTELEGDALLEPEWCLRVSPEGDEFESDSGGDTGGKGGTSETGGSAPPCGNYNLAGAIALGGSTEAPSVLYCDTDLGGGVRFAQLTDAGEGLQTRLVDMDACLADVDTGLITSAEDGTRLFWSTLDGLKTAVLNDGGNFVEEPTVYEELVRPWKLRLLESSEQRSRLVVADMDRTLWLVSLDHEGGLEAEELAPEITAFDAVEHDDGLLIAACDTALEPLELYRRDADGLLTTLPSPEGAVCGRDSRPSLAWHGNMVALTWHDDEEGHILWMEPDGTVLGTASMGAQATYPQVAWHGGSYVLLDGTGTFRTFDSEGLETGSWQQPMLAQRSGSLAGQRMLLDDQRWTALQIGQDLLSTDLGHFYIFHYVEVTTAPAPSP